MTLRKTEIIEWSTTPAELRRIADEMEGMWDRGKYKYTKVIGEKGNFFKVVFNEGQWQAEQAEEKE